MTPFTRIALVAAMASTSALSSARTAEAQSFAGTPGRHVSGFDVEPHFVFGYGFSRGPGDYGGGFGGGIRFGIPLMRNGPVPSINNSLVLSLGADFTWWSGHIDHSNVWVSSEVVIPVMLQWNFYLAPAFSLFPEAGIAIGFAGCGDCGVYVAPGFALGGRIHFSRDAGYPALVIRIGFPVGLTAGIAF